MNIDVVDSSGNDNGFLVSIRNMLEREISVRNVPDMVARVLLTLDRFGDRLRRLRVFGHGNLGVQAVGGGQNPTNRYQLLGIQPRRVQAMRGTTPFVYLDYNSGRLTNEAHLRLLRDSFETGGWAELHGCQVAAGTGVWLLTRLSMVWGVPVKASTDMQVPGGGLEGLVLVARPDGSIERRY